MSMIVINLMPDLQTYERELNEALINSGYDIRNIKWAKLKTKVYREKLGEFLPEYYIFIDELLSQGELVDSVIITGAPVENLEFNDVHYWDELRNVIKYCIETGIKLLGICWGALAIASVIGIKKVNLSKKVFGVYRLNLLPQTGINDKWQNSSLISPFSISAAFCEASVIRALKEGKILVHATSQSLGPSLISSNSGMVLMSLGHFEYAAKRLKEEWVRDSLNEAKTTHEPENYCLNTLTPCWKEYSKTFFQLWFQE